MTCEKCSLTILIGLIILLLPVAATFPNDVTNSGGDSGCTETNSNSPAKTDVELIAVYEDFGLPGDIMKLIRELATNPRPVSSDEHKKLYESGCSFRIVLRSGDGMTFEIDDYWQMVFFKSKMESRVFSLEYWLTVPKSKGIDKEMSEELRKIVSDAGIVRSRFQDWQGNWVVMYDDRYDVYSEDGELLRSGPGYLPYSIEIEGLRIVYVQMLPEFFTVVTYDDGSVRYFNGKGEIVEIETGNG